MVEMLVGGKKGCRLRFVDSEDRIALRTVGRTALRKRDLSQRASRLSGRVVRETAFASDDILIYRARGSVSAEEARALLKAEDAVEFAGRVIAEEETGEPFAYTERVFVRFEPDAGPATLRGLLSGLDGFWDVERRLPYGRNCFVLRPKERIGQDVFGRAMDLLGEPAVSRCHPEFLRQRDNKAAFPKQWHLGSRDIGGTLVDQSANVEAAWAMARGEGVVVAVIDDGVDASHPEFSAQGKIVAPYDFSDDVANARPKKSSDIHGTPCAGIACASGARGASGVAPAARLMPIRISNALGSLADADAIYWAARHGADVISCSWGPKDGDWMNPNDPRHTAQSPIPDSTAAAIESALASGRVGKGCVVAWAAGNGNESVDLDGYASFPGVMAIAACDDRGVRSVYSDFGDAIACAFPSNTYQVSGGPAPVTKGLFTTDRRGLHGYAKAPGAGGDFVEDFGGTSGATPGAAGVAALVLSAGPTLTGAEAREIMLSTCDRIDPAGGQYDASGHSPFYGRGRLNAERAVRAAMSEPGPPVA